MSNLDALSSPPEQRKISLRTDWMSNFPSQAQQVVIHVVAAASLKNPLRPIRLRTEPRSFPASTLTFPPNLRLAQENMQPCAETRKQETCGAAPSCNSRLLATKTNVTAHSGFKWGFPRPHFPPSHVHAWTNANVFIPRLLLRPHVSGILPST
jgi:hypothetical protein